MFSAYLRNYCYNKNIRKIPYKGFTGLKPILNKMLIFGTTCFVMSKIKLDPRCKKGIFVSYDKPSPAYLIYFLETMAIKRVRCLKFTVFYNSPLMKQELQDYITTTYDEQLKDNLNIEEEV